MMIYRISHILVFFFTFFSLKYLYGKRDFFIKRSYSTIVNNLKSNVNKQKGKSASFKMVSSLEHLIEKARFRAHGFSFILELVS